MDGGSAQTKHARSSKTLLWSLLDSFPQYIVHVHIDMRRAEMLGKRLTFNNLFQVPSQFVPWALFNNNRDNSHPWTVNSFNDGGEQSV